MLTEGLLRDPDSHVTASVAGWAYVPGPVARVVTDAFEGWVNAQRQPGKVPWHAERPWTNGAPAASRSALPTLSEEDRRQRELLEQMFSMASAPEPEQDE